jgi:hypothetical protein
MSDPIRAAMLLLLRAGSRARLELGIADKEGDITAGFHCGFDEGEFVVMTSPSDPTTAAEFVFLTCDEDAARNLASALLAFADYCVEQRAKFEAAAREGGK